jgi:hypothetical protein
VDTKKIVTICSSSITSESKGGPAPQQEQQESGSIEVGVSLFVDEDQVLRVFPQRKFARKPCTSACEHPPGSSLTFGRDFTPANVASKRRQPKSRGRRPRNLGDQTFGEPFWPKPVIVQGQGRVASRGCVPGVHSNPRLHPQGHEDQGRVCPLLRCTPSSPVLRFPCICRYMMSGNEEGRCFLEQPPKQEDTRSSPLSSMELKFELDTRLTVSCVVAVALAYGLVTVLIAIDSVLLAFGNAVILLLILFVLFGWRELLARVWQEKISGKIDSSNSREFFLQNEF